MHLVLHNVLMASRMTEPVIRRPSLPLTAKDELDLDQIRRSPSFQRALSEVAGSLPAGASESVLLHAVFTAGLEAVRRAAAEAGYAELAEQYRAGAEDRRAIQRRRQPQWADEG